MPSSASPWLQERPQHFGGAWALGCWVCHHGFEARVQVAARRAHRALLKPREKDHRKNGRASKWARYEVNWLASPAQAVRYMRRHSETLAHRRACLALPTAAARDAGPPLLGTVVPLAPLDSVQEGAAVGAAENAVVCASQEVSFDFSAADDEHLRVFRGRVPQAKEWADAWADSTSEVSFRKQVKTAEKRGDHIRQNMREIRRKQLTIMAEVARRDVRQKLKRARVISLAIDEAQRKKIVRFRCDSETAPYHVEGVLGVMDCDRASTEDHAEDHALVGIRK